ncbi:MAG: YfhO family protein, partial [Clostridia bacterium]|nr:YfhO family protein [Clostridia bacterium]
MGKTGIKIAVFLVIALILSLFAEVGIFMYDTVFDFSLPSYSLMDENVCNVKNEGYTVNKNVYTPNGPDAQILFEDVQKEAKTLLISFSKKNYSNASLDVIYKTEGEEYTNENIPKNMTVPYGATELIIPLPQEHYQSLGIKIDGVFALKNIEISNGDAIPVRRIASSFSILRFCVITAVFFGCVFVLSLLLKIIMPLLKNVKTQISRLFNGIRKFVNRHPLITLLILMVLSCGIVFFPYLFMNRIFIFSDIGSDTENVYYPFFSALQRKLATGDATMWDFTHGLGTNAITRQADIGSIFTWIICLFGINNIKYTIVIVHIIKVLLSGIVCYYYLDCFKTSSKVKIVVSYVFAFNGFTMLWGQHYFFGTACTVICLMLLAVEKCLVSKKGYLLLAFATFIAAFNSYYYAYMILIVTAVYALFRLIATHSFKEKGKCLKKIGLMFGAVFLGIGMASCLFLPAIKTVISTSARLDGDASKIDVLMGYIKGPFYDGPTTKGIISRFFSNNFYGSDKYMGVLNYYEMPQWFFSSFIVFFITLFVTDTFIDNEISKKVKV